MEMYTCIGVINKRESKKRKSSYLFVVMTLKSLFDCQMVSLHMDTSSGLIC